MASSISELSWSCIMEDDDHDQFGSGKEALEMVDALRASLFEDSQAIDQDCCDNERLRSLIQSLEAEINNPLGDPEPAGSSFMDVEIQMDHDQDGDDQSHDDGDHETCSSVGSLMWGQDCWTPLDHNDIVYHDLVASSPNDDEMNNWWVEPSGDGFMHGVALRGSDLWEETALYDLEMHQ